jgi:hypothetical protein
MVSRIICQNPQAPSSPLWDPFADREGISKEMSLQIEKMVKASVA